MTFEEALEWIEEEIKPAQASTVRIERLLDYYHDWIARELRIPTKSVTGQDATSAFSLPADARDWSLIRVYEELDNSALSRISAHHIEEATRLYPRWRATDFGTKIVVFEPTRDGFQVTPAGFEAGDTLRYSYVAKPTALSTNTQQLWDGHLPDYHHMIANRVVAELLMREPNQQLVERGKVVRGQVDEEMKRAFAHSWYMEGME